VARNRQNRKAPISNVGSRESAEVGLFESHGSDRSRLSLLTSCSLDLKLRASGADLKPGYVRLQYNEFSRMEDRPVS
jgi:hypothetical protein